MRWSSFAGHDPLATCPFLCDGDPPPELFRRFLPQPRVSPQALVIASDVAEGFAPGLTRVRTQPVLKQLGFVPGKEALRLRVIPSVAPPRHALPTSIGGGHRAKVI
jgi:hypothetical protein